nr:retrovirus-related Pol polyprotein from transposon TNT 1-94 [Tanacetum cinerariifolium]
QADWRDDTDDEPEDQELEAHYMYMTQIQEVNPDAIDNSGPIFDSEPLQKVSNDDNYNVFSIESEHPEQYKSVNDTYPIEQDEHNMFINSLDMSYDRDQVDQDDDDDDLANERDLLASLIEKTKCEIDDSKNHNKILETSNKALIDKLQGQIEDFKTKNKSLESSNNHFKEANNELSKTNQLMYKDLKKFQAELDRYNDVKYASKVEIDSAKAKGRNDTDDEPDDQELEAHYLYMKKIQEVTPNADDTSRPIFDTELLQKDDDDLTKERDLLASLVEKLKCEIDDNKNRNKILKSSNKTLSDKLKGEIEDLKAQLQDKGIAISELKKLIEKLKGKSVETKFEKSFVIRQPNAFKSQRPSILGKPTILSDSLERKDCSKSKYTWTHFLRSKDETPEVLSDFLRLVQRGLHAQVRIIRTDKGTEFLNKTLHAYFAFEGIHHQTSVARTPEQNGVVEKRNRTLVEAARTMLSVAKVPLFFWAEAIATACFTQNRSLIIPRHKKTPYHIINDRKPFVKFFHIFGSLGYIVRDGENLDKIKEKGDACIFIGYSTQSRAYRVFNKRTRVIVETIHVNFDELPHMTSDHVSSDPVPQCQRTALKHDSLSPCPQCQENVPHAAGIVTTSNELDLLFSPMFDELLNGSTQVVSKSSVVTTADAPKICQQKHTTPLNAQTTPEPTCQVPTQAPTVTSIENINQAEPITENAQVKDDEFINIFCTPVQDQGEASSRHVDSLNMHTFYQRHSSKHRRMKEHPLEQVIGNPSQSVRTRRQLESDGEIALMYLTASRPDIVHATCYCAHYQAKPTEKHLTAVKRIFRYLKDTIHMGLWYLKDTGFELTAFSDSDHVGCLDSRKITCCVIQFLGGDRLVSYLCKKQDCTSMSLADVEYVSLSACCAQVLWMRTQLTDYGFYFDKIPMYCDSKATIAISCNPVQHSRTKHIDVRYHFIKEKVENGIVELFFVRTEYQLADLFTKALSEDRFKYLVRRLGMRCLTPEELEVLGNESA